MKKGISPVIAIVMILILTITIVGLGANFIQNYYGGLTQGAIEFVDATCDNNGVTIFVRNIGNDPINIIDGKDVAYARTTTSPPNPSKNPNFNTSLNLSYNPTTGNINPNTLGTIHDENCNTRAQDGRDLVCIYTLAAGGRVTRIQAIC